jgi:CIC family chloride channel protein
VAIIGGPFTMTFLVLETTGDFGLTAATLTAAIVASLFVRETFGYSFSTWRLHLRGETIRSAHDVSWLRNLTAGRMMREGAPTIGEGASLEALRQAFPLGSTRRLVVLDAAGRYAGLIALSAAYGEGDATRPVSDLMIQKTHWLTPEMTIKDVMAQFDLSEADELAVLSPDRKVQGIVTESHATRRYAEELERARRDLVGAE